MHTTGENGIDLEVLEFIVRFMDIVDICQQDLLKYMYLSMQSRGWEVGTGY